jgi:hypothetical protein
MKPKLICFKLLMQLARRAFSLARANTGNRMAARIAIMAITTKSSINVNALRLIMLLREIAILVLPYKVLLLDGHVIIIPSYLSFETLLFSHSFWNPVIF